VAEAKVASETADVGEFLTAVACKSAGGRWSGGHDISGHVFLLVLGCGFLMQEVGWVAARWAGMGSDERGVVMSDGVVKRAGAESTTVVGEEKRGDGLRIGGKFAVGVMALSCWMLLMTAIYFHTWFEKVGSSPAQSTLSNSNASKTAHRTFDCAAWTICRVRRPKALLNNPPGRRPTRHLRDTSEVLGLAIRCCNGGMMGFRCIEDTSIDTLITLLTTF